MYGAQSIAGDAPPVIQELAASSAVTGFAVGVVAALLLPSRRAARWISLLSAVAGSAAAIVLAVNVIATGTPWTSGLTPRLGPLGGFSVTVDRLGALFLGLVGFVGGPSALYGLGYLRDEDQHPAGRLQLALFNVFLAAMCLVSAADNVFTFLFGWELMALASYGLVVSDTSSRESAAAGVWYAGMTQAGFVALLAAFFTLAHGTTLDFSAIRDHARAMSSTAQISVFALALFAFGSKAGLVPLHVWLPRAHPAAPSHVSALMSAAMVKLGVYGCIRVLFDLLPAGPAWWGGVILVAGLVTAVTGVLYSVTESHLKRVLAYSTIENIGIVFVGIGFALLMRGYGHENLAAIGLVVALLHVLNHAAVKALLFFASGAVVQQVGSGSLEAYGGLVKRMPQTAVFCCIGALSLAALPPFNGFVSEWLTFQFLVGGARHTAPELAILLPLALGGLALTVGLAAVAAVRLFGITFLALPRTSAAASATECAASMRFAMALMAVVCVGAGVVPALALAAPSAVARDLGLPGASLDGALAVVFPLVGSQLRPLAIALALGVTAALIATPVAWRRRTIQKSDAWNCGRIAQSARTEYTAASFAEPLRRVFVGFYRPTHQVTIDTHPVSTYFVRSIAYRGALAPWLEQAIYVPLVRLVARVASRTRRVQGGSIHAYLAYVAAALIVMLLLSNWLK